VSIAKHVVRNGWEDVVDASERKGEATAHAMASVKARVELARFFMLDIIPFSPRFVSWFAGDFSRWRRRSSLA
jgi:hypothetical protein